MGAHEVGDNETDAEQAREGEGEVVGGLGPDPVGWWAISGLSVLVRTRSHAGLPGSQAGRSRNCKGGA